jgi:hypothetical protein
LNYFSILRLVLSLLKLPLIPFRLDLVFFLLFVLLFDIITGCFYTLHAFILGLFLCLIELDVC